MENTIHVPSIITEESNTEGEWRRKKIRGKYRREEDRRNVEWDNLGNHVEFGPLLEGPIGRSSKEVRNTIKSNIPNNGNW